MVFKLTSPAFDDDQPIPVKYTCDGQNVSPPLQWSDPPPGTKSFALIVEDPDAPSGTFRHWGLYNIMGERTMLPEAIGHGPKTERLGKGVNDFGELGYGGPAPPKGHGVHHYHFKLAALDVDELSRSPSMPVLDIWNAAEKHAIGQAELVGTYRR
ncbi:YbhB/YbcL family Raf kinase inhibitor-like protein [Bradyrhizobium icense]|uniref:Phosphatidylethanolamine-binding protein n=1 Tax=Bradyrhizobium icense TaxID=1274631 RepID=A0A1B1UN41_9BRAD|nr:YbhB/YbcL family Raf kinase inhibitor-like protein [Bradyrhizobium icense]ANW04128.1 phosphatidylethanolamine-binding protein [Bradyrhizobium icense]